MSYHCHPCCKSFRSFAALNQHLAASSRHNVCTRCDYSPDFPTLEELDDHWEEEHHWCSICNDTLDDWNDLEQHRQNQHNKCLTCGKYFSSPSNLRYHQLVHREKSIECFVCYRTFVTKSAMVLHLEFGNCESRVNIDIVDRIAESCRRCHEYLEESDEYFDEYDELFDEDDKYKCPTCANHFRDMSGLLQHAESDYCSESLKRRNGPLAVFLRHLKATVLDYVQGITDMN